MDNKSPLSFLNIDVSLYLYETYFPDKKSKYFKNILKNEYLTNIQTYTNKYDIENIYENHVMFCIRCCLYKEVSFFSYLAEFKLTKEKIINHYIHLHKMTPAHRRAIQYKEESDKLKNYVNYIQ